MPRLVDSIARPAIDYWLVLAGGWYLCVTMHRLPELGHRLTFISY
jgi:hypothetical protein